MELLNDRYQLKEKIASGGMAEVYIAEDTTLGRKVAIKMLHSQLAKDTVYVERFKREAQAVANLNHPNIVNIYDWGSVIFDDSERYYLVMEVLEGKPLNELLEERGRFSPDESIDIILQVCAALSYAHSNDIIHRDIKPHNIILSPTGHVKVTDFGIARSINEEATMTQTGMLLGTPQYFSPEQAQGVAVVPASDIYSLGVTFYEILTGSPPFTGDSALSIAFKHVHDAPEPPRELNPRISSDLQKVMLRMLDKKPENRYSNADDLTNDLKLIMEGRGIKAAPVDLTKTQILAPSGQLPSSQSKQQKKPTKSSKKLKRWIIVLISLAIIFSLFAFNIIPWQKWIKVTVPNVEGLMIGEAKVILAKKGFKVSMTTEESKLHEKGIVIDQDPKRETQASRGSTIKLTVSSGMPLIEVPDLLGLSQIETGQVLGAEGLGIGKISDGVSDIYEKGEVMAQDPYVGAKVKAGTLINIIINKGIEMADVPNIVGNSHTDALKKLNDASLLVKESSEYSNTYAKGLIISQSPSANQSVRKGSTVSIVISKGKQTVTLPNYYSRPIETVKKDISNLGLKYSIKYKETNLYSPGIVISQNPMKGTEVAVGNTVTLIVSQKPKTTIPTTSP